MRGTQVNLGAHRLVEGQGFITGMGMENKYIHNHRSSLDSKPHGLLKVLHASLKSVHRTTTWEALF